MVILLCFLTFVLEFSASHSCVTPVSQPRYARLTNEIRASPDHETQKTLIVNPAFATAKTRKMKVQFEFAPIPQPQSKGNKLRYYPRVVNRHLVKTREISAEIQHACSLTEIDVNAVLDALSRSLANYLRQGERVHLQGIGFFDVTLTCPETRDPKKTRPSKVTYKGVNFRPDKDLKNQIADLKAERGKAGSSRSAQLSDTAIDMRLTEYFEDHPILTRYDLQGVCQMTRITAIRCIRRLLSEGKIKNIGLKHQPIYVPVPGHYGVSADRK